MIQPEFDFLTLNPDAKTDQYKAYKKLSVVKQKQVEWEVEAIAAKEIVKMGADANFYSTALWIENFSRRCPEVLAVVLDGLIEPMDKRSMDPIKKLFYDDKLDWKFVEETCAPFTKSSLLNVTKQEPVNSQPVSETTSPNTEIKTTEDNPQPQV